MHFFKKRKCGTFTSPKRPEKVLSCNVSVWYLIINYFLQIVIGKMFWIFKCKNYK